MRIGSPTATAVFPRNAHIRARRRRLSLRQGREPASSFAQRCKLASVFVVYWSKSHRANATVAQPIAMNHPTVATPARYSHARGHILMHLCPSGIIRKFGFDVHLNRYGVAMIRLQQDFHLQTICRIGTMGFMRTPYQIVQGGTNVTFTQRV
jgi:hypothetical protein